MPAPSSIVPIDIACSFRIDRCTCVPGPSRPGHAPRTGPRACRLPDRATAPGRPQTTSRDAPAARPTCRRPCPPPLREYRRDRGNFVGRPPSRARGRQKWPPRCRHSPRQSQVCRSQSRPPSPDWGRAITGRLKQIPMFAQVSSYRKHCARARDRVRAARARRSTPLATRRIDPQRPMRTRSRQARTCS